VSGETLPTDKFYLDFDGSRVQIKRLTAISHAVIGNREYWGEPSAGDLVYVPNLKEIHIFDGIQWSVVSPLTLISLVSGGGGGITPASGLPKVCQIRFSTTATVGEDYTDQGVTLILDRPAPAGCYIQFFRLSRKSGSYVRHEPHGIIVRKRAFRPIYINNCINRLQTYWVLPIPVGATRVTTAPIKTLYRPERLRGGMAADSYRPGSKARSYQRIGYKSHGVFSLRHANKCLYKFGVKVGTGQCEQEGFVEMSSDTLEIQTYFSSNGTGIQPPTNPNGSPRFAKLIARIY